MAEPTQRAHDVKMTSYQRRCDVMTSHRRRSDVILTSCACWEQLPQHVCLSGRLIRCYTFKLTGIVIKGRSGDFSQLWDIMTCDLSKSPICMDSMTKPLLGQTQTSMLLTSNHVVGHWLINTSSQSIPHEPNRRGQNSHPVTLGNCTRIYTWDWSHSEIKATKRGLTHIRKLKSLRKLAHAIYTDFFSFKN